MLQNAQHSSEYSSIFELNNTAVNGAFVKLGHMNNPESAADVRGLRNSTSNTNISQDAQLDLVSFTRKEKNQPSNPLWTSTNRRGTRTFSSSC